MTWIHLIYYVLLSSVVPLASSSRNYNEFQPMPAWPRRGAGRMGNQPDPPPQPIADSYLPERYSDYSDYERSSIPRSEDHLPNQAGWRSEPAQLPNNLKGSIKSPYMAVPDWPSTDVKMGQISAVCFDQEGNVVVFHRGNHVWNALSFLPNEVYNQKELGAIAVKTVVVFDAMSGKVVRDWGADFFYMPHGLTVDKQSNVWVTDVALHQVFKFPPNGGSGQPVLALGTRFEPGNDDTHFCKPSGVAVMTSGDFFVSDGYCNHRIIKFSADGRKLLQWGRSTVYGIAGKPSPYAFAVPHALALAEDKGALCVADRENGRITCFNVLNGTYLSEIKLPEFGHRLFSVAYSSLQGGMLFAVNGPDILFNNTIVQGFVVGLTSQQLVAVFKPGEQGLSNPHDIAVSADGKQIYVVQLDPSRVWKFVEKTNEDLSQFPASRLTVVQPSSSTEAQVNPVPTSPVALDMLAKDALQSPSHPLMPHIEPAPHLLSLSMQILIAAAAILALIMVAGLFVFARRKGPMCSCWMCYKRWQFRRTPSEGFKLGSLLDPHSGFEQVCTEMSDEEEIDASSTSTRRPTDSSMPRA